MDDATPEHLNLLQGLIEWCDPELVEAVRSEERHFTAYELHNYLSVKLSHPREWSQASPGRFGGPDFTLLDAAWESLLRDFADRVLRGEVHLQGVQVEPTLETARRPIPDVWASDFRFDFEDNGIRVYQYRYTAVRVSRIPWPEPTPVPDRTEAASTVSILDALTAERISELSPEQVALLLERHAAHVRDDMGIELLPPGKVSIIALLAAKMRRRAEVGDLRPTLMEEADWLCEWGMGAAPTHYCPQAKTIANKLGALYRNLMG